jgi:glycosyltransferase involved in cell wall biosynthesis
MALWFVRSSGKKPERGEQLKYSGDGPAVMLCESSSIFPAQLATYWRAKGLEVILVTQNSTAPTALRDGTRVIRSSQYETRFIRSVTRRLMTPVLYRLEGTVPRFRSRFSRVTGLSPDSELWMPNFASYVESAWPMAKAALAQRPRFVFGHEVTSHGLATALCRGVPRIIFPWGGDVFTYAESSPYHLGLVKLLLRKIDLIIPSSTTAARHIVERFGVEPDTVRPVSWGVDRQMFRKANPEQRKAVCQRWGIDSNAAVFLNARRFRPVWGGFVALEAFIQLAREYSPAHFVLFGGLDTEGFMSQARTRLEREGLLSKFTLLEGDAPLEVCAELMSISDLFVSLLGRGDMRSVSVLQATASGAVPVVSDLMEYREMERLGFAAYFVRPDSVEDVLAALRLLFQDPAKARAMAERNVAYIAEHEDMNNQMDKMMSLINEVCDSYAVR